jgi:hypothetical protein
MSRLDELPPDQRAALSLLLSRRKSYREVAGLLGIPEHSVRDRAHAALAVLAPAQARLVGAESRSEIGDYLLSQQPGVAERLQTRAALAASEPARAWARAVSLEIAPLAPSGLPEIPAAGPGAQAPAGGQGSRQTPAPLSGAVGSGTGAVASPSSSRLGGALLLGAIVIVIVIAIVILSGNNGSSTSSTRTGASTTTAARAKSTKGPKIVAHIVMRPPDHRSRSIGLVDILEESGKRAFYIAAENLPASRGFFYAIWLYSSPGHAQPVSKSPAVGSSHKLAGGALLPTNAAEYSQMLLTRETKALPTHPGKVVLQGALNLTG